MIKTYTALFFSVWFSLQSVLAQNQINGRVFDESKEPVVGASVLINGTKNGTSTDFEGNFSLSTSLNFPLKITIAFIGYKPVEVEVSNDKVIVVRLEPDNQILNEVNVVESRLSEKQKESALTVEAMDILAIKETPSVSFYEGLGNLKGVDLTSASIGFKIINTRGFNSTSPVRSLQIIDGVDNQSPGLNFSLGNFLGASELDILNVDIIAGASTAFYGPNAFNGVISMTTKDPYTYKGLSASVKAGERAMTEVAVRWADAVKNKNGEEKFAYKINLFYLKANDWQATNLDAVDESNVTNTPTPAGNPGGYDAVNRYGDEDPYDDGGDVRSYPGLGTYHRSGIEEKYIVNYNTQNLKFSTSLHYKIKPDLELTYAFNFGTGTTVYQGDNRFSLKGIKFFQNRISLEKKNKWFIRAYSTNEDAGESYDAYFTALKMQDSIVNSQLWSNQYRTFWSIFYNDSVKSLPGYPSESLPTDQYTAALNQFVQNNKEQFTSWHNQNQRFTNNFNGTGAYLTPGTAEFDQLLNTVTGKLLSQGGSRLYDKSALYHLQGEYKFEPLKIGTFIVGGNGRLYTPKSLGTIFSDTNGITITNHEFGAYGSWEKRFVRDRLKLNATMRVDKNKNFDFLVSPAISAVYDLDEVNTIRVSFSAAIRNPTLLDQYMYYNTGRAVLIGNLEGYDSLVTLDNLRDFLGKSATDREKHDFEFFAVDPIKPERVRTIEMGYRTTLWKKVYIDANYYYSWYNNFIGYTIAGQGIDPTQIINPFENLNIYRIASNARQRVTTQGFSIGVNYYFAKYYSISGNYTWNVLNTEREDPIVPAFNTPENKYNFSFGGRNIKVTSDGNATWGYNITYKWIQGFRFEGSPQFTGFIESYGLLDAQVSMNVKSWKTTFKLGASNLLNNYVYQVYGGPQVGRLAYFTITYDWIR